MNAWHRIFVALFAVPTLALVGCEQRVTQPDVDAAREAYEQRAEEAQRALEEGRPDADEAARRAEEARLRLEEMETRRALEQERDRFVEQQQQLMRRYEADVAALREQATLMEGEQRQALNEKIDRIENLLDEARRQLTQLQNADVDQWHAMREPVEDALRRAGELIAEAGRDH